MRINPLLLTDGYKTAHHNMYPKGTTLVYSNFTPRTNKYAPKGCDQVMSFGQQMIMKIIHEAFQDDFFSQPKDVVCGEMKRELSLYLNTDYDVTHFEKLHDLGYLPIHVKVIEEGTLVPIKVPVLTIYNTHADFFWLTNYFFFFGEIYIVILLPSNLGICSTLPNSSSSCANLNKRISPLSLNKIGIPELVMVQSLNIANVGSVFAEF